MSSNIISEKNWILDPLQLGRISRIIDARTTKFDKLVQLSELRPESDFIGSNLDCIDFGESDLRNFNFTDCTCKYSNFSKANTSTTIFSRTNVWMARISTEQLKQMKGKVENLDSVSVAFDFPDRKRVAELVRGILDNSNIPMSFFSDLAKIDRRTVSRFLNNARVSDESVLKIIKGAKTLLDSSIRDKSLSSDAMMDYEVFGNVVIKKTGKIAHRNIYISHDLHQAELFSLISELGEK